MPTLVPPTVAQVLVILVPCYAVAYATDKVVYVVPTLASASVLSRALTLKTDDDYDGEGTMPKVKAMAMVTMPEAASAEGWVPDRVHDISLPASFCSQNPDLTVRR